MRHTLLIYLILCGMGISAQNLQGDWKGTINLPGRPLNIALHFETGDSLTGTMDIPDQNAKGLQLSPIEQKEDSLIFNIPDAPGNPVFRGLVYSDSISGKFIQLGNEMKLIVQRFSEEDARKEAEKLEEKLSRIEALADSILGQTNTPGASIGIWYKGDAVMSKGFGMADVEKKVAADNQTLFAIGSSSKAFTAMLLSMLVDEDQLDWDDKVIDHMPDFRLMDPFATQEMTPIDLLTHQSGLPRHDLMWYGSNRTRQEIFERLRYLEPTESFRSDFQYQNIMYMTAGMLAGRITNSTWEEQVRDRIFNPLGMSASSFSVDGLNSNPRAATGYETTKDETKPMEYRSLDNAGPAGSINSTSDDMLNWVGFLMNNGILDEKEIVSPAAVKKVMQPHFIMSHSQSDPDLTPLTYGLGWMINHYKGHKLVQHGGNIDGFSALVFLAPDDELGMVILTNENGSSYPSVMSMSIMDIMVDEIEERDWLSTQLPMLDMDESKEESKPVEGTAHHFKLEEYAGKYEHPAYGVIEVAAKDDQLLVNYETFEMKCSHWHYEVFRGKVESPELDFDFLFRANKNGKVDAVEVAMEAMLPDIRFEKLPPPVLEDNELVSNLTGEYDLSGISFEVSFTEGKLYLIGQGNKLELIPVSRTEFEIDKMNNFIIEFIFDEEGEPASKFKSHQPNGTFVANRKTEK